MSEYHYQNFCEIFIKIEKKKIRDQQCWVKKSGPPPEITHIVIVMQGTFKFGEFYIKI